MPANETAVNFANEQNKLKEKQFDVWCELVQCLDRKLSSLIKTANSNGTRRRTFCKTVSNVVNVLVSINVE